ncbi:MAG: hypothetical protein WKG00_12465 [Polyangiaceae bacterium]
MMVCRWQSTRTAFLPLFLVAAFGLAGCGESPDDCPDGLRCPADPSGTGGTGNTGGAGGEGGQGGSGGGPIPGCEDAPASNAEVITDTCGVFVSATAATGGNGTKAKPFKTMGEGLQGAGNKRVYVCAEDYDEAVVVPAGTEVYGGFDCKAEWAWKADQKARIVAAAGEIPLIITGGAGTLLENLVAEAATATEAGGSSIAAIVDGGEAALVGVELIAGAGKEGAEGDDAPVAAAQAGQMGSPGSGCNAAADVPGGQGHENECDGVAPPESAGGDGGAGKTGNGSPGDTGLPSAGAGEGGNGDDGTASWSCATDGGSGSEGSQGSNGAAGAAGEAVGALSTAGIVGGDGGNGQPGLPGQGGGGGGGRAATQICPGPHGPTGGGGGSGGCGGTGGKEARPGARASRW